MCFRVVTVSVMLPGLIPQYVVMHVTSGSIARATAYPLKHTTTFTKKPGDASSVSHFCQILSVSILMKLVLTPAVIQTSQQDLTPTTQTNPTITPAVPIKTRPIVSTFVPLSTAHQKMQHHLFITKPLLHNHLKTNLIQQLKTPQTQTLLTLYLPKNTTGAPLY